MTFKDKILDNLEFRDLSEDPCWDTHKQVGTKMKGSKEVPNCVPKEEVVQELTSAEKKLINQMYDKKGNLTPMGKKVMAHGKSKVSLKKEEVELDENKNFIKDYEKYVSQGNKKDHNAIDYLMSMPKYKRMSKDQMAKIIGDHKRKGIFREDKLEEGLSPKQIEQLKKAYASMPDRVPMDMAQKMGAILKKRSKEELIAIARADIKWLSTTAATNLIIKGVKASEIRG